MIAGKIRYVKTHDCTNSQKNNIAIEQHTDGRVSHWYCNIDNRLYGIKFCPYCGKDLYKTID